MEGGWTWPKTTGNCHFPAVHSRPLAETNRRGGERFLGKKENIL